MVEFGVRRRAVVRVIALAGALLSAAVPLAIGAGSAPKTGNYISAKAATHKYVAFSVVKKHGRYKISDFGIYCQKSSSHFGAVILQKSVKISSTGAFSYKGPAMHIKGGVPAGSAKMTMSGKFVTSTTAKGTASFTGASSAGCPHHSFTARRTKS